MNRVRVAHIADSHLDDKDLGDNIRVHAAAIDQMREAEPDLIVHAGDLHHKKSSPEIRLAGLEIIDALGSIAPVILIRGNHDPLGDLAVYEGRRTPHPVRVFERAQVVPAVLPGVDVQVLPWFDKVHLAARLDSAEATATTTDQLAIRAARELLRTFAAYANPYNLTIGVGHLTVGGSVLSTGQTLVGSGVEFAPTDLLGSGAQAWMLGHIHMRQEFADGRVRFAGSPQRHNYGEPEAKGWLLWTVERGRAAAAEFRELPARKIERVELDQTLVRAIVEDGLVEPETLDRLFVSDIDGARVRLRFPARPDELATIDLAALERAFLAAGAGEVKIEPQIEHDTRVRSAEMRPTAGIAEQLDLWLDSREITDVDLRRRLHLRLDQLQSATDRQPTAVEG